MINGIIFLGREKMETRYFYLFELENEDLK